jgi:hypothetical protein
VGAESNAPDDEVVRPIQSKGKKTVVVLACRYDTPNGRPFDPDHRRLDALAAAYPQLHVLGSTELNPAPRATGAAASQHVNANWKKSLAPVLEEEPRVLLLDYFWLATGYYESNYGTNWLSAKLHEALVIGSVDVMILPEDTSDSLATMAAAAKSRSKFPPTGVAMEYLTAAEAEKHHPLVVATLAIDNDLKGLWHKNQSARGRYHDGQMSRLAATHPFVVVYRTGLDWRSYFAELRVAPASEEAAAHAAVGGGDNDDDDDDDDGGARGDATAASETEPDGIGSGSILVVFQVPSSSAGVPLSSPNAASHQDKKDKKDKKAKGVADAVASLMRAAGDADAAEQIVHHAPAEMSLAQLGATFDTVVRTWAAHKPARSTNPTHPNPTQTNPTQLNST